jgi:regulator of protease activity HflC (stomatin/prohibitin superfamily)
MATGTFRFEDVPLSGLRRAQLYLARNRSAIYLGLLVLAFLLAASAQWIFVTVPAGHIGVMWYRLDGGTDTGPSYGEGVRIVLPWDRMEIYDARVQHFSRDFEVLTRDGLVVTVNIAWQFRIKEATVGLLHKFVGPDYVETMLVPAVASYTRHVFSRNSTDDAYTLRRAEIQDEIHQGVINELRLGVRRSEAQGAPWILLENVLIRGMRFPPEVEAAINRKMEQYQLRQEYAYRLERERLESERKEVEADGIARFQRIVGAGISENYLRWKGIDATLALARSSNAKVVVIGTPRDGMPLILGGSDTGPAGAGKSPDAERTQDTPGRPDPAVTSRDPVPTPASPEGSAAASGMSARSVE